MENNIATINGLMDGISVLENNKFEQPALQSDVLFNDKEPIDLNDFEYPSGSSVSEYTDYQMEDFGESVTLLGTITIEEAILGNKA